MPWLMGLLVGLLVLKAAMPWLASTSAQLQGKALGEVCTVYGVTGKLPAMPDTALDHPADGCLLSVLVFQGATGTPAPGLVRARADRSITSVGDVETAPLADAAAQWARRLGHGPPGRG